MEIRAVTADDIKELSALSVQLGNVPFFAGQVKAAILIDEKEIIGFSAVQSAWHAAGSWMREDHRKQGKTYELRSCLDNELRKDGIKVYFAIPSNDFEKQLFAKYGHVTEQAIQVRHL